MNEQISRLGFPIICFIVPVVVIIVGGLACFGLWQLQSQRRIGLLFTVYLLGSIASTLAFPAIYLVMSTSLFVFGGGINLLQPNQESALLGNYFPELINSMTSLLHALLLGFGVGGTTAMGLLLAVSLFAERNALDARPPARTRVEYAVVLVMSIIGWVSFFTWPFDIALSPPP